MATMPEWTQIQQAIAELNASGLIKNKINIIDKKPIVIENFRWTVEQLDDAGHLDDIPETSYEVYDAISRVISLHPGVKAYDFALREPTEKESKKVAAGLGDRPISPADEIIEDGINQYGHKTGTMFARMDEIIEPGATIGEIITILSDEYGLTEKTILSHIRKYITFELPEKVDTPVTVIYASQIYNTFIKIGDYRLQIS